jgi:hypothetical protein
LSRGETRRGRQERGKAYRGVVFVMAEVDGGKGALAYALAIRDVVPDVESLVLLHVHCWCSGSIERVVQRKRCEEMDGDDARRWRGVGDG